MKEAGAAAVMVHGIVGPDAIQDCIDTAAGELGVIVQLELTHPGGLIFTQPIAADMAAAAAVLDIFGVQAPGNRPERIREIRAIVGPEPIIVCCGVGAQGGTYHQALKAGGTYVIVGRAIYNAADPKKAVQALLRA
ncbi:MAG: orotidine 5'-phosphate decarboxylase [Planctomycetes bacterium]|nr:orotidine 5'-phosphate decarboxylase [Planctomycetota bacterium]